MWHKWCLRQQVARYHVTASRWKASGFKFPAMSPTMTEGNIIAWRVKEGDTFATGDVLLEIETDKASMEVEAPDEGKMFKILKGDGAQKVQVNSTVAFLAEVDDDLSTLTVPDLQEPTPSKQIETSSPKASKTSEPAKASEILTSTSAPLAPLPVTKSSGAPAVQFPSVHHLLHLYNIDVATTPAMTASGPKGRLLKGDVLAYIEAKKLQRYQRAPLPPFPAASTTTPATSRTSAATLTVPYQFYRSERSALPTFLTSIAESIGRRLPGRKLYLTADGTASILHAKTKNNIDIENKPLKGPIPKDYIWVDATDKAIKEGRQPDIRVAKRSRREVPAWEAPTRKAAMQTSFQPYLDSHHKVVAQSEIDFDYILGRRSTTTVQHNESPMAIAHLFKGQFVLDATHPDRAVFQKTLTSAIQEHQ